MDKIFIKNSLTKIGLALNASHNTVTTDAVEVEPTETSWRIDHKQELVLLKQIEDLIFNTDTCPLCGGSNTCLLDKARAPDKPDEKP